MLSWLKYQSHNTFLKVDISHNLVGIDSANNVSSAAALFSADCSDHTDGLAGRVSTFHFPVCI